MSFGFRPKRSAIQALDVIRAEANAKKDWVLDGDLSNCFGSIDHDALLAQVARWVSDRQMLALLRTWLRAGCWSQRGLIRWMMRLAARNRHTRE